MMEETNVETPPNLPAIRGDLITSRQSHRGEFCYVVKDPETRRFFRFREHERFIIGLLDGGHTVGTIREKFEAAFEAELPAEMLEAFTDNLGRLGLLEGSNGAPARRHWNPFYLRFRLFNPDRLLAWMVPSTHALFSRGFLRLSGALILLGFALTSANAGEIAAEVPKLLSVHSFALIWFTAVFVIWVHEFGHGLACKRHGGEVPEMGFLLLFFMPAFYCNVSDAWLFPDKRKRIGVILAGAYIELTVWAVATILWRLTEAGTAPNHLALIVMVTSGAKTFFNFNPLIKLDGYYMLSDWLEIPNLRTKAVGYVRALLGLNFSVLRSVGPRERRVYLVYGTLAGLYTFLILFFILRWAGGYLIGRFQGLGFILFLMALTLLFRNFLKRIWGNLFRRSPAGGEEAGTVKRLLKWSAALVAVAAVLYFGHWDLTISSSFEVAPKRNADIRAEVEGIIQKVFVREGDKVKVGDPLALISPREYVAQIAKIKEQIAEKGANLRGLLSGPRAEEIKLARQEVETARTELMFKKRALDEGLQLHRMRLGKARVTLDKAKTRLGFARKYFDLKKRLFQEGLLSHREFLEAQESFEIRRKELDEAREEVRLVENDRLVILKSAVALSEKKLKEGDEKLALLLAGSRPEDVEAARAEIARLRVELSHLRSQEQLTRIVSPETGVVTTPKLKEKIGEWVKKGDLIMEVYDFTSVVAEMSVPEREIGDVRFGHPVVLKARSFPGRTFRGRVTAIAPVAKENLLEKVVTVRSEIENPDLLLRPGMSGNAKIVAGSRMLFDLLTRRIVRIIRVEFWSFY